MIGLRGRVYLESDVYCDEKYGADIEIPEIFVKCFEPMDICDDPSIRYAVGGVSSARAEIVMKMREGAAEELSNYIAELLLREMSKKDTINGYKVKAQRDSESFEEFVRSTR